MQGWLNGPSHILKTAIMVPSKRMSRAIAATFWPRGRRALRARRPRGPNVKKMMLLHDSSFPKLFVHPHDSGLPNVFTNLY